MNDSVETADEASGRHRVRPVLRTVSEDEDQAVFHNDYVEHDMNDGPDENEKTEAESKGIESTSTETTPHVAVETAGVTGEEQSDRSTVNEEADHIVGDDHHARCIHLVVEAGSIVSHQQQHERRKKDGEEAGETTAATETEQISKKTWKSEDSLRRGEEHPKKRNND